MSRKQNYLKMGSHAVSLVLAVTFLAATSVKADLLKGTAGDETITFATNAQITGNGYTYRQTFTLEEGSVFTKVFLDPQSISMALGHTVNNDGYNGTPAFDTSGLYDVTVTWKGSIGINTAGLDKFNDYGAGQSKTEEGVKYTGELLDGVASTARSTPIDVSFEDLASIGYTKEELAGISEITFEFFLSDLSVDSSVYDGEANINTGFGGVVNGLFYLEWEAATTATPEPASLLICGMGAAGAGLVAYRKRQGKK